MIGCESSFRRRKNNVDSAISELLRLAQFVSDHLADLTL
jgi:hypothetical protein